MCNYAMYDEYIIRSAHSTAKTCLSLDVNIVTFSPYDVKRLFKMRVKSLPNTISRVIPL